MKHPISIAILFYLLHGSIPLDSQVLINEFLASNAATIADPEFGDYADWLELYNAGSSPVSLSGWHLTDSANDSLKWTFPAGTSIPAGGYLLLWADGTGAGLHAGFKLGAGGEQLGLYNAAG